MNTPYDVVSIAIIYMQFSCNNCTIILDVVSYTIFIECNALQFLYNNCGFSNVMENIHEAKMLQP